MRGWPIVHKGDPDRRRGRLNKVGYWPDDIGASLRVLISKLELQL